MPSPEYLGDAVDNYLVPGIKTIGKKLGDFVDFDRQFTEDVLNTPKYIYENPAKSLQVAKDVLTKGSISKTIQSGVTAAGDALKGNLQPYDFNSETGEFTPSQELIQRSGDMASVGGSGGLMSGATEGTLGSAPFLRPALKYNEKIYKAPTGGQHLDALTPEMYNEFSKKAMSGQDINEYQFGFMNHKGQFLSREKALDYAIDHGLVEPDTAKYGTLTSTLMSDSSKPGVALESAAKSQKPFFSAVENAVDTITQPKMNGKDWLGTIGNKPGVKPEELDWNGLKDYLTSKADQPVTKAEIQQHLAENNIELGKVVKGGDALKIAAQEFQKQAEKHKDTEVKGNYYYPDEFEQGLWDGSLTPKDLPADLQPYAQKMLDLRSMQTDPTKFSKYQLPGGENYQEKLFTLPTPNDNYIKFTDNLRAKYGDKPLGQMPMTDAERAYIDKQVSAFGDDGGKYKSSHWEEPNVLAHVRTNQRDVEGVRSHHIEEIQSDWHQQGRDRGYKTSDLPPSPRNFKDFLAEKGITDPAEVQRIWHDRSNPNSESVKLINEHDAEVNKRTEDLAKANRGVPDAPFKKTWHELVLKDAIRHAAENGIDRISWTPGEAQAARYDLSKSINKISYNPKQNYIKAWDHNGKEVIAKSDVKPENLPDIVGKEAADKILKQEPKNFDKLPDVERKNLTVSETEHQYVVKNVDGRSVSPGKGTVGSKEEALDYAERYLNNTAKEINQKRELEYGRLGPTHILEGQDLKIGGEGMKGFYDSIIPKAVEKLGKAHGVKVKQGDSLTKSINKTVDDRYSITGDRRIFDTLEEAKKAASSPVHYFDIPQSMKDQALQKGFPLFSGGVMLVPVEGDPTK